MPLLKSDYDVDSLLEFTQALAVDAGKVIMTHFKNLRIVKHKSDVDLVTQADTESEQFIIDQISNSYPNHDIITEEQDLQLSNSPYQWIIDPLDGTTNFVHGLPIFAVSIALKIEGQTILGVVYNPANSDMYSASASNKAVKNGKEITVSKTESLKKSLLVTGFPYSHNEEYHLCFSLFHDLYNRTQGIRRLGAAALDFCYVAEGVFDGFYEINLNPWDIAAGEFIVRKAGGTTSDWTRNKMSQSGKRILATNGIIHDEVLSVFDKDKYELLLANN